MWLLRPAASLTPRSERWSGPDTNRLTCVFCPHSRRITLRWWCRSHSIIRQERVRVADASGRTAFLRSSVRKVLRRDLSRAGGLRGGRGVSRAGLPAFSGKAQDDFESRMRHGKSRLSTRPPWLRGHGRRSISGDARARAEENDTGRAATSIHSRPHALLSPPTDVRCGHLYVRRIRLSSESSGGHRVSTPCARAFGPARPVRVRVLADIRRKARHSVLDRSNRSGAGGHSSFRVSFRSAEIPARDGLSVPRTSRPQGP